MEIISFPGSFLKTHKNRTISTARQPDDAELPDSFAEEDVLPPAGRISVLADDGADLRPVADGMHKNMQAELAVTGRDFAAGAAPSSIRPSILAARPTHISANSAGHIMAGGIFSIKLVDMPA